MIHLFRNVLPLPIGFIMGYEIEFCIPSSVLQRNEDAASLDPSSDTWGPSRTDIVRHILRPLTPYFKIGTDTSLRPEDPDDYQAEIRTDTLRELDLKVLSEALSYIRNDAKAFLTRTCGFHIHWSWDPAHDVDKMKTTQMYQACVRLTKKFKPHAERQNYCSWNSSRGTRYSPVRCVSFDENHYEIRILNGTLKMRGLAHYLKTVLNEAELIARGSQAPEIQSVGLTDVSGA